MKNISKTIKTILFTSLIAIIMLPSMISNAEASHGTGSWDHDEITWQCYATVIYMTVNNNLMPCPEFADATDVWTDISNSDLEFSQVQSNPDMTVGAEYLSSGDWAQNTVSILASTGEVIDSDILFNTDSNYTWGDLEGFDSDATDVKDFMSTAIHEAGHSIRLAHDSNSALMSDGHGMSDIYRTMSSHDRSAVQGLYP